MPQKPRALLKSNISKKARLPQATSREAIGKENNKRNDKNKSGDDQRVLNNVSNISGHTLTPKGIKHPVGWIHTWGTLLAMVPPLDFPDQQRLLKKTPPAFEVTTRIDVRRNGNHTRIHSFVSTSTINRERIQSPLFLNTIHNRTNSSSSVALPFANARSLFGSQTFYHQTSTSTQSAIDIAKRAHELSVFVHQKVHDLYQLVNCTTMGRTDQVNTLIFTGESVEQTSFQTICQDAMGKAETQNNQGMKQESEIRPFSTDTITDRTVQETPHFSAEEAAHKLSRTFQTSFENKHNTTINPTNHVHNQVTETFWNDLTKLFYQFFSQHEHAEPIQEQRETSGSLLTYFADWLLNAFSLSYGENISNHRQSQKDLQVPMRTHLTDNSLPTQTSKKKKQENNSQELASEMVPESAPKATTALSPEEENILPQIWHLLEDFYGRVDGFLQRFNFDIFPRLGAEAAVLPATVSEELILHSSKELSAETVAKIKQIMKAYLDHKPSNEPNTVPFPPFWYDHETFQLRHKIQVVNQKVKDYLCGQGVSCDGLSGVELLEAVEKWEEKDGLETKMSRRRRLASVIRKASGLQNIDLKYTKATYILFQWRNNNIFQGYTFEDQQQPTLKESQQTILEEPVTIEVSTASTQKYQTIKSMIPLPSVVMDPQLQCSEDISRETRLKLYNIVSTYMNGQQPQESVPKNLPSFWYDLKVFEKRGEVETVNQAVHQFLCQKKVRCPHMSGQQLLVTAQNWGKEEGAESEAIKRKQVANIILKASSLPPRELTDTDVAAIIMQWQDNNIFKGYQFKDIEQTHTEATVASKGIPTSKTVTLNDTQSSTPAPMRRLKKGEGGNVSPSSMSTKLPIETSSVQQRVTGSSISTTQPSNTYEKVYEENLEKFNSIITAFFEGKTSQVSTSEILPAYFFEDAKEVYKKRHETLKANDRIKKFLCEQKVPCEGLSILQLITATQGWIRKEGKEAEGARSKQVANTILSSLGLSNQEITEKQANAIFMQWRNNNIFKDFKLGDIPSHGGTPIKNSELVGTLTATRLHSYGVLSFEVASTMNEMHVAYFDKRPLTMSIHKPLIPFWYDFTLYQKRDKTAKANESVKQFLYKQQISSEILTAQQTVMAAHKWVNNKQTDADILEKQKKLAPFILEGYGIVGRNLSDTDVANTVLQWENNNIFSEYTFIELKQSSLNESQFRNETLTENSEMKVVPDTITDPDLELVHKAIEEIVNDVSPLTIPQESLPIFYYHFPLFQKRSETAAVNKKLNEFFTNEGIEIKDSSIHELEKGLLQWVEKEDKDKTEREQFLTYFILKAYGVEDIRLGEFLSSVKIQAIFKQWKVNTVLAGRTYKEITRETIHHQLSKAENPLMIHFKEQKKESDQIFADFIHDRPAKIPKNHPVNTIYYNLDLFENREATPKVNTAVRTFLLGKKVSFSDQSTSELVRKLREWILEEPKYPTIIEREKEVAVLLQKEYGLEERTMTTNEARLFLLQWENNNAQVGYTYQKTNAFDVVQVSEVETAKEQKQKLETFINENNASLSKEVSSEIRKESQPKLNEEQKEIVRKRVVSFLISKGVDCEKDDPNTLVKKASHWMLLKGGDEEIVNITKLKELAKIILNDGTVGGISEKDAQDTVINWMLYTVVEKSSQLSTTESPKKSQPTLTEEQKEIIRKRVVSFLISKGVDCGKDDPNTLVEKASKWTLLEGEGEEIVNITKLKELAKIILNRGTKEIISEEEAQDTVTNWMMYTAVVKNSQLRSTSGPSKEVSTEETSTVPSIITEKQKSKYEVNDWRNPNIKVQIEQFFKQKKLLTDSVTKEKLLITMGKWFTKEGTGVVLGHAELKSLAKVILKELKFYAVEGKEEISDKDIELTVMKWVFENVLGSSVEVYAVKNILAASNPAEFSIGQIRKLFEVDELNKAGVLALDTQGFSDEEKITFKKLWVLFVEKTLPNYFLETSGLADELLISDYGSLTQLIGAKLLEDEGYRSQFNQSEIRALGAYFCDTIAHKGLDNLEELRYILMTALLAVAQLEPELLRKSLEKGNYKEVALNTFIGYWKKGYFQVLSTQENINELFHIYQNALLLWRRKQALVKGVAKKCQDEGSPTISLILEQRYLGGSEPCSDHFRPPKLEDFYVSLTKSVSEAYYPLDKKLIEIAIKMMNYKELAFLFSADTHIYEGNVELKDTIDGRSDGLRKGDIPAVFLTKAMEWKNTVFKLEQTDLIVAVRGNEERWYALKNWEEGGYVFYRVDKDPLLYLKYGLFNQKDKWSKGYQKKGEAIKIGVSYFTFSTRVNYSKKISQGTDEQLLIDVLSQTHRDDLYDNLYELGNDKTILEKTWNIGKHFIPFYDCITDAAKKKVADAIPSCTIDIVLLIPVLGQITALNTKFASGVAKAIMKGGIRNAIHRFPRYAPKFAELKNVLKSVVRYVDPGLELVTGGGKLITRGLVKGKRFFVTNEVKNVLEKLEKLEKGSYDLAQGVEMIRMADNGPEVAVRWKKNHLYLRVTNIKTGNVYGGYFVKKGNQLEVFRGQASFTDEQIVLIYRLSVDLDNITAVEPNVNPKAYGEGQIITVIKKGEDTKYFIKMRNKNIPVRITAVEGQGVRYDVLSGDRIYPVNYNGVEWYFEASTSPFVTKGLVEEISKKIDEFESLKDPTPLSPPYERELMYDKSGRTHIKINDHYIPLILFDRNNGRYHLVKKDVDAPMMVLRFDSNNGGFRMETIKEKKELGLAIQEDILERRGKALFKWKSGSSKTSSEDASQGSPSTSHESPGTSQGSSSTSHESAPGTPQEVPGTSKEAIPKVLLDEPYPELPTAPANWAEWVKFKHAKRDVGLRKFIGHSRVDLRTLSTFPPEWQAYYLDDETLVIKRVYEEIDKNFYPRPKFEVFVGLDSTNVQDYFKPFQVELREDFKKAQKKFESAVELYEKLLKEKNLSSTKEGGYLIQMLKLQDVPEKEAILRESVIRLNSLSKKGSVFLKMSKDLAFQNVWTLSTELIYDEKVQKYYSSVEHTITTEAFTLRKDSECRIFIFADAYYPNPKLKKNRPSGPDAVMHEVTHHVIDSEDLVKYPQAKLGLRNNGKKILEIYDQKYPELIKEDSQVLLNYGYELAHALELSEDYLTPEMLKAALEANHTLRAHFQLTDAEMLMAIIRDHVEGRAFDAKILAKRDTNNNAQLGNGDLFTVQALSYVSGSVNFKRIMQQNKIQEQTTDIPDLTSSATSQSNKPISGSRKKREVGSTAIEPTKNVVNQRLLKLINKSIKRSNHPNQYDSDQLVRTKHPKNIAKRSDLNLVSENAENSNRISQITSDQLVNNSDTNNSFLNLLFASKKRSSEINQTVSIQQVNKNLIELAAQH
ncbi:MAG: QWxxN domain [Enterococcus sp.]